MGSAPDSVTAPSLALLAMCGEAKAASASAAPSPPPPVPTVPPVPAVPPVQAAAPVQMAPASTQSLLGEAAAAHVARQTYVAGWSAAGAASQERQRSEIVWRCEFHVHISMKRPIFSSTIPSHLVHLATFFLRNRLKKHKHID